MNNKKLGMGLSALLGDSAKNRNSEAVIEHLSHDQEIVEWVPVNKIVSGVYQPRKHFDHDQLAELAKSIKENGIIQPIILRQADNARGIYEIIAGERRYRASKIAGLNKVPAIIKNATNAEALEFAIIENVQRTDLSAIEEARGYRQLMNEFSYTQEQISGRIGRSRSHIANILRLLSMPKEVQDMVDKGLISSGHARAIINRDDIIEFAHKIAKESLSVREVEDLAKDQPAANSKKTTESKPKQKPAKNQHLKNLEDNLAKLIGDNLKVKANYDNKKQKGKITIFYKDLSEVEELIKRFE
jgi:ParB family chromosome partitioning protein